jgi:hypothetical protein
MVKISKWFNACLRLFTQEWSAWLLAGLIFCTVALFTALLGLLCMVLLVSINMDPHDIESVSRVLQLSSQQGFPASAHTFTKLMAGAPVEAVQQFSLILNISMLFTFLCAALVLSPLAAGIFKAAFNQMRTGAMRASDIFPGFRVAAHSVAASLILGPLIAMGLCLCVVPGLYLMAVSALVPPLMAEKGMAFPAAFRESRRIIGQDFWRHALFLFNGAGLLILSAFFCFLLVPAAVSLCFLMLAVLMRETAGVDGAQTIAEKQARAAAYRPFADYTLPQEPPQEQWPAGAVPPPPALPRETALSFCAQCGGRVTTPGARFCEFCGRPLGGA